MQATARLSTGGPDGVPAAALARLLAVASEADLEALVTAYTQHQGGDALFVASTSPAGLSMAAAAAVASPSLRHLARDLRAAALPAPPGRAAQALLVSPYSAPLSAATLTGRAVSLTAAKGARPPPLATSTGRRPAPAPSPAAAGAKTTAGSSRRPLPGPAGDEPDEDAIARALERIRAQRAM